jgi:ABC-type antimicrobial peptide transport system permease subunit
VTLLSKLLFGVTAHDPVSFLTVPIILGVVATIASYLPARRASRLDPLQAIKR